MEKWTKILIIILITIILIFGGIIAYKVFQTNREIKENEIIESKEEEILNVEIQVEEKEPQIFKGEDRPIAVMIDNHSDAWPQAGLNDAYMVYEIIVEGGETRLMAVFKGKDVENIGPVRSSRHYFLDYALENDAIYVHYGWSPQAQSDISKLKVNNINGISESSSDFWRINTKVSPHNVLTSIDSILKMAKSKGYKTTSTKRSVLNYQADKVELNGAQEALKVTIPHSNLQTVRYEYDEENKVYNRYARNRKQTDYDTGDVVQSKNIIITFCNNYTLEDSENKGRQGLTNVGTFDGYYITEGQAIKIKCIKESRTSQTQYVDLEGREIEVNDGNTWVNICPVNAKVVIEGGNEHANI